MYQQQEQDAPPQYQMHESPPVRQTNYQTMPNRNEHTSVYIGEPQFNGFSNKAIRSAFVAKVYSILCVQLLIAVALISLFTFHEPTKNHVIQYGEYWLYSSLGVGLVVYFILVCVDQARYSYPCNFILLLILTLAYGTMAATLSARFDTITVLCAIGATTFATVVVILLAKFSPFDITTCGCGLCILSLLHLILGIVLVLVLVPMGYASTASLILAALGAFLISLYLLMDLQLIMGDRSVALSPEEYILGATLLYVNIIHLFQNMLILTSAARN